MCQRQRWHRNEHVKRRFSSLSTRPQHSEVWGIPNWHVNCSGLLGIASDQRRTQLAYLVPSEFVTKMVDAGESKIFMSTRDTLIRAYMAGAILALAAWFAITINVATGQPLVGALLFPVGFVHAEPVRLRSADRRICADAFGLDRQAARRDVQWCFEELGPGFCRQLCRRVNNRLSDGVRDDVWFHAGARQGRHRDRQYRRSPDVGLRSAWRGRHGDVVLARRACATGWCRLVLSVP